MGPIHPASPPPSGSSLLSQQSQQQQPPLPLSSRTTVRRILLLAIAIFLTAQLHLTLDSITHTSHDVRDCHEANAHGPPPKIEYITKYITSAPKIEYIIRNRTVVRMREVYLTMAPVPAPRPRPTTTTTITTRASPAMHQNAMIPKKKMLPSITEKGMIIIFLHIPKTGTCSFWKTESSL